MQPEFEKAMVPDVEQYAPSTAITPAQIEESQNQMKAATAQERAEAERKHQELCDRQNAQLREIYLQRQIGGLLPNS